MSVHKFMMTVKERFMKQTFLEPAMAYAVEQTRKNLDTFVSKYPHVSTGNVYEGEENHLWTSSFYPGMAFLAYDYTKDEQFLAHGDDYMDSFEYRLKNRIGISHDLGFLYTLSCVANYKLTGNKRAFKLANEAAEVLAERYNEKGHYIQAWREMGATYPDVKIIIDTMLNLPLLYWSENLEHTEIAKNHAMTCSKTLIREDFSSFHTYLMRPETGDAVVGKTHQGYEDASTWARGQGWAVYGFALTYRYTKDPWFLKVAIETARVFEENLPEDKVAYWDFTFTDANPDIRDTSAAAIYACGLLELCEHVGIHERKHYKTLALEILESLDKKYSTKEQADSNGILTEGVYHRNDGAEECVSWGDYFYMEALNRLLKPFTPFW